MSDLIRRKDAVKALNEDVKWLESEGAIGLDIVEMRNRVLEWLYELPTAEPKEYVKDGTLTVQMPTIKEAKAVDKIVVYADTYKQEYHKPREWEWCHTCKEYDQERHSCPRMRDVISRTVKELEEQYKPMERSE